MQNPQTQRPQRGEMQREAGERDFKVYRIAGIEEMGF
jgi:hypothetical protein